MTWPPDNRCDWCGAPMILDVNGYWVGDDDTSNCPANPLVGHEVDGQTHG